MTVGIGDGMTGAVAVLPPVEGEELPNRAPGEPQDQTSAAPAVSLLADQDRTNQLARMPREVLNTVISKLKTGSMSYEAHETRRRLGSTNTETHEAVSEHPEHQDSQRKVVSAAALHRQIEAQRSHANLAEIIELRGELDKLKDYVPPMIANANSDALRVAIEEHAREIRRRATTENMFLEMTRGFRLAHLRDNEP